MITMTDAEPWSRVGGEPPRSCPQCGHGLVVRVIRVLSETNPSVFCPVNSDVCQSYLYWAPTPAWEAERVLDSMLSPE